RAVLQTRDAGAFGGELRAQRLVEVAHQLFAFLDPFGRNDELGEIRAGQLLVQREIEARRADADEVDVMVDSRKRGERRLQALSVAQRRSKRRALLQSKVDQQLRPLGRGEKLLGNQ